MSLTPSLTAAEAACATALTPVFLERLGDARQEELYRQAIDEARRQGLPEIAQSAQAWLQFSTATRYFEYAILAVEERAKK